MTGPSHIRLVAPRHGQGLTTVALALAVAATADDREVALISEHLDDLCAMAGLATVEPGGELRLAPRLVAASHPRLFGDLTIEEVTVGATSHGPADLTLMVLRGPDYLSLRTASSSGLAADGVVLIREPWRALAPADVTSVLGAPVVAEIGHSDSVARSIDAGLILSRGSALAAFRPLARLAAVGLHPAFAQVA